ncbi:MAG: hypothetical protein IJ849_09375 [Selenomonadaceae bacterium]|nr:hypothetical protein [Selenomonadaceae bacterium]
MLTIRIPLLEFDKRPVVKLYNMDALIDTGAYIPTFTTSATFLLNNFQAKVLFEKVPVGGIGGIAQGKIYRLQNFRVGRLNFECLDVFVPDKKRLDYEFLLSATMFYGFSYGFNAENKCFEINMPDAALLSRKFEVARLKERFCSKVDGLLLQTFATVAALR